MGNRSLTLSIPTMLILTFRILCVDKIGSRAAAACIISITTTITTKISAPGRLQIVDFPPPALLVYGTHNEGRLGKKPAPDPSLFHHFRTPLRTPTSIINDAKTDEKTAPDAPLFHHFRTLLRTPTHIRIRSKTDQKTAPDTPLPPHPDTTNNTNITGSVPPWDAGPLPHTQKDY